MCSLANIWTSQQHCVESNHHLSGMIHLPLLIPHHTASSTSYVYYLPFIIHSHIIHNSCFVKCLHMRTAESLWGVPRCCRPARATHSASCVPDYQGWGAEETWRKQEEDGVWVRSRRWVCWLSVGRGWICRAVGYVQRQDILEEEETGGKEAENKIKGIVWHFRK